jgi:2,4-dienoyl-CoA reductase-like NADH-dependent reductase (Old Yellow Enzyme family)
MKLVKNHYELGRNRKMELKNLFSPSKIGNLQVKNRIIRSATAENMAENGHPSDQLISLYNELAEGGVGLIVTGGIAIDPSSTLTKKGTCLYSDEFISSHSKVCSSVHEYDVKIAAQIVHAGRQSGNRRYEAVAPSAITYSRTGRTPRALTKEEIRNVIKMFIECGRRAFESEYDMVQLHAAHGYLLSSFLSPYTNKRTDDFGESSLSNRTRILVDIYNGIRDEVGSSFPILIKLQTHDGDLTDGLPIDDGLKIAKIISDTGFDAIEPSGGGGDLVGTKKSFPSVQIESTEDEN